MTMYPSKFYVAHRLFSGRPFPKPVWGDILDGPTEHASDVVDAVLEAFKDDSGTGYEEMTRANLRVWMMDGIRYHDMTDSVIRACDARLEAAA